jgi:mRNA interferase HicA
MKRSELIRFLVGQGCYLKRHGKRHDIYANPATGRQAPVPRHKQIKESLVKLIEKQLVLEGEPPK